MAHLNMTYSNTNNAKPLSITMLKNHVGTLSLNFKQQPDTIFFRQHHTFVLSFFYWLCHNKWLIFDEK